MNKKNTLYLLFVLCAVSCAGVSNGTSSARPCDKNATPETVALYRNLFAARDKGIMLGHQDDLAYGVNWRYEEGRSDVKDVTGDYPAVYGWDIGRIENKADKNLDGVPFEQMRQYIKEVYDRGGVSTISWHTNNPMTGGDAWDNTPGTVASVLPGGANHAKYKGWLDNAAEFLLSLKGSDGKPVPILWRPYHEFTGTWFWWCKNTTGAEQFKALWKFNQEYFQSKGLHNLIYVYNTSDANVKTKADFMEYYPGDGFVDMLSFDIYQGSEANSREKFIADTQNLVAIMAEAGREHNKLTAIAEAGFEQVPDPKWWTQTLLTAIVSHKISYVLLWRNHGWNEWMKPPRMHYYVPYKGDVSAQDFIDFYKLDHTLFQSDVTKLKLYK